MSNKLERVYISLLALRNKIEEVGGIDTIIGVPNVRGKLNDMLSLLRDKTDADNLKAMLSAVEIEREFRG